MKVKTIFLLFALACLQFACKDNSAVGQEKALEDEMMDIHDEVMPKMGEATQLHKAMMDTLYNNTTMTIETREKMSQTAATLDQCINGMTNWMNGISDLELRKKGMKHEAIMQMLTQEKDNIAKIGEIMTTQMQDAKAHLDAMKK
jgi:hypothetical protein